MPESETKRKKIVVVEEDVPEEKKKEVAAEETKSEPVEVVEVKPESHIAPASPPRPMKEPRQFNLFFFLLVLFFVFLITVFVGGLYVYFSGGKKPTTALTPTPSVAPVASEVPSASNAPTLAPTSTPTTVSSLKVSVLNGSGKVGEAGKVKALLEKAGFSVGSTGNASAFSFTDTQIQVKSTVSADATAKLKDSLKGSYPVVDGKALDAKSQFDIIVTVGSKGI
jgi:hypothetical protein